MYGSHPQGGKPLVPRARAVLLIGLLALTALALALVGAQTSATAAPKPKVTVCHATGSATNPYVQISVSQNAVKNHGHAAHADDIIAPQGGDCPDAGGPGGGGNDKVDVCHRTGSETNPVVMINISENAVQHHLDHGDFLADATTGCTIIPDEEEPESNGGTKTPGATVVVTQTAAVTTSVPSKQAARSCTSRRSFRIRVRSKRRDPVVNASVSVNGKRVKSLKGKRVTAPVVLRGLPKGTFLVKITATTRKGRKISGTRRYKTCTPKAARQTIPLL